MFNSQKRPMLECKTAQCSVHKSVQCWNVKGERQTINVHQIHSRSDWCGNLHALQGAEQGPKPGSESPPVCKTGCRNPCKKSIEKKSCPPSIGRKRCPARQTLD